MFENLGVNVDLPLDVNQEVLVICEKGHQEVTVLICSHQLFYYFLRIVNFLHVHYVDNSFVA